jgi:hypothetical protein
MLEVHRLIRVGVKVISAHVVARLPRTKAWGCC